MDTGASQTPHLPVAASSADVVKASERAPGCRSVAELLAVSWPSTHSTHAGREAGSGGAACRGGSSKRLGAPQIANTAWRWWELHQTGPHNISSGLQAELVGSHLYLVELSVDLYLTRITAESG
ncbi:hypothetical protein MHYP_G00296560 [Metynnis hypsauchen]